jgi:thioredoxin 1
MVQPTTSSNFKADVLDATVPVLVDFWAPWCGPCRVAGPILDRVSEKAEPKAKVYKLNIDEEPATASQFGISAIPTVIVFRNGKVDTTLIGVQQEQAYLKALGLV